MLEPANEEAATDVAPAPRADRVSRRGVLTRRFDDRLAELDHCERCRRDAHEKCVDRRLGSEDTFTVGDVTCGCGCWSHVAYLDQLGLGEATELTAQQGTDIRPVDLPEIRAEIIEWLDGPVAAKRWHKLMGDGWYDWIFGDRARRDPQETGSLHRRAEIERLRRSTLFYVAADMVELACVAAQTIPDFDLAPEDLPADAGLIVFAKPIAALRSGNVKDVNQATVGITAVCWAHHPAAESGIMLTTYFDRAAFSAVASHAMVPDPFDKDPRLSFRPSGEFFWKYGDPEFADSRGDAVLATDFGLAPILRATWLLMQQPLAANSNVTLPRPARRRLQRTNHEPADVRLIELRRAKGSGGSGTGSGREYHHQWIVRGHWRQQWYPARQVHRPVWIAPHIKGPEDAPLLGGEKVNVWKR